MRSGGWDRARDGRGIDEQRPAGKRTERASAQEPYKAMGEIMKKSSELGN